MSLQGVPEIFRPGARQLPAKVAPGRLSSSWEVLRYHAGQTGYLRSPTRFNICHAGRRSGKTLLAIIRLILLAFGAPPGAVIAILAPTWGQVKRVYLDRVEKMLAGALPPGCSLSVDRSPDGCHFTIWPQGVTIWLVAGGAADRFEGGEAGLYHVLIDEMGNMPATVWQENIRPQLMQTRGTADLVGVPEGPNHYHKLALDATAEQQARQYLDAGDAAAARELLAGHGIDPAGGLDWSIHRWDSADILPAEEIAAMRRDLDPALFEQEAKGAFVSFEGRVYRDFHPETHCRPLRHLYRLAAPLIVCFDFNVEPGVAVIAQELELDGVLTTCVLGEVYIPQDSTTDSVCTELVREWKGHPGEVRVYGDATGGSRKTSADAGVTDWTIISNSLRAAFEQVWLQHPPHRRRKGNPAEIDRVSCMNARIQTADGARHLAVDPARAPMTVRDLEAVRYKPGTREIWKGNDEKVRGTTHLTDGLGYYIVERWPIPDQSADRVRDVRFAVA